MDPHMTDEDRTIYELGPHRRLIQQLEPPRPKHVKKKKLVNFKVSLRRRSVKEDAQRKSSTGSVTFAPRPEGRKNSVTFLQEEGETLEHLRESRESVRPLNEGGNDARNVILERKDTKTTKERREAFRSTGEQRMAARRSLDRRSSSTVVNLGLSMEQDLRNANIDRRDDNLTFQRDEQLSRKTKHSLALDNHRRTSSTEDSNDSPVRPTPPRTTTVNKVSEVKKVPGAESKRPPLPKLDSLENFHPVHRRKNDFFSRSSSLSSSENWSKIKTVATPRSRMNSLVEMLITRKRSSLAPSIWTPSVPRSAPGPRPVNFQDQEERGKGSFVVSFILYKTAAKQRPHLRFRRRPPTLALPERELKGKQYLTWLSKLVANPLLSTGVLLKGLEIGVQFPVIHLREVPAEGVRGGEHRRLEASLGHDCTLVQGEYEEVIAWVPELLVTCPSDPSQWARCFILLGFMTLDGELNQKMEKLWKEWTGSLFIYCNIDDELGLKRLAFYRRRSPHQVKLFSYMVTVELDTVTRKNCLHLLDFVYRMRLRSMSGYISVYQAHSYDEEADTKAATVSSCASSSASSYSTSTASTSSAQSEKTPMSTSATIPE